MNLTETIVPKSDQINADDLMAAPITVTITGHRRGSAEQPVDFELAEFPGRAYRPSKSMRRVMVSAWGAEAANYAGHRLTLFRNPEIKFGAEKVGGIEIAAMSHIDKALTIALTATRGKRKAFTVQPLKDAAPTAAPYIDPDVITAWVTKFDEATTLEELQGIWGEAKTAGVVTNADVVAAKDRKKAALS